MLSNFWRGKRGGQTGEEMVVSRSQNNVKTEYTYGGRLKETFLNMLFPTEFTVALPEFSTQLWHINDTCYIHAWLTD